MFNGFKKLLLLFVLPVFWLMTKGPWHGAQTSLFGVLEEGNLIRSGAYYADCRLAEPGIFSLDPNNKKLLWERSEQLLGVKFDAK